MQVIRCDRGMLWRATVRMHGLPIRGFDRRCEIRMCLAQDLLALDAPASPIWGDHVPSEQLPHFAHSLSRFIDNRNPSRFTTGRWLQSLSDDELYRLDALIGLALGHNNESAWDDLALTCMKANGAEQGLGNTLLLLNGDEVLERVTTLRVLTAVEAVRRRGAIKLRRELTIQPGGVVETEQSRFAYGRRLHFAN
jgi:hypothetical protein